MRNEEKLQPEKVNKGIEAGQIKIHYYTDPLCCWSWAFETHWRKLLFEFKGHITYQYVMCGMIPDWSTYNDPINSVSKPLQMGPVWMHASQLTGTKMNYGIWHQDPPQSSYPACIAVKCAALQSPQAEDLFLHQLRVALMEGGQNISKSIVLAEIASKVAEQYPSVFSLEHFNNAWQNGLGKEIFRSDLQKAKYHNIGRYPTLTFQNAKGKGVIIVGYRPYDILVKAIEQVL